MPTRKICDIDQLKVCRNPEHDPPKHMVYEDGVWEHTCPSCGKKQVFTVVNDRLKVSDGEYW